MKKITESIGCYVTTPCCTECDWFKQPLLYDRGLVQLIQRTVCPKCGAPVQEMVGRYKIKETNALFYTTTECVGFIRKDKEQEGSMSNNKPAVMSPDFYISKLNERGHYLQIYCSPGDVLIAVFDARGSRIGQEKGADLELTLATVASKILNPDTEAAA